MSSTPLKQPTQPKQPTQNNLPHKRGRKRKGKGARALQRRREAEAQEEAQKEEKDELEERKKSLGLKRGDVVETRPSSRYPVSTELTVNNIAYNPNRDDFMITFYGGSSHAWGKNLGISFYKKLQEEK
jgi:hypothetical protein